MSTVELPRPLVNQLLQQAQAATENEICGLISAIKGYAHHCYPIPNTASDTQHHFIMDEKSLINAMRQIREQGEELFAIYHSHPTAPAIPSNEDLNLDEYADVLKLIISLNTTGVLEMRGFYTRNEEIEDVELVLAEWSSHSL
jgi:proteasome lid subunit RPN8/RPN11